MSCFFSCFRVKHASSSTSKKSSPEETTVNRNRSPLSSFLIPEETVRVASKGNGLVERDLDFEELRNQAKFLKACGTPPQTPPEIGKFAARKNDLSSQKGTVESLKIGSLLTYTSDEKLDLESQQDQLSNFNKDSKEWLYEAGSQEHTPSSCLSFDQNIEGNSQNSSEGNVVQSVESSEYLSVGDHNLSESSVSSYTTAGNLNNAKPCKKSEVVTPESSNGSKTSVSPLPGMGTPNMDGSRSTTTGAENLQSVKNPGDRPIIGLVATHWNDTEHPRVSPKWWDGNGIPNSTNKYREDQKVSWIATSFEERLEKALSEESLISQRRQSGGTPPAVNNSVETEESDTAMSKLQPSKSHLKPVVSF